MFKTKYESPIGTLYLVSDGECLCNLYFSNQPLDSCNNDSLEVFIQVKDWLDQYFAGKQPNIAMLSLKLNGSTFQKQVWKLLLDIPYGSVVTYGDIAKKLDTKAYQAVGRTIGKNPIGIIVPCHRVVGKDKKLVGFSGDMSIKKYLLAHEGIDVNEYK